MTRLVRLNEVQYAETEHQIAGLVAQGFVPVPLEVAKNVAEKIVEAVVAAADPTKKEKPAKGKKEGAAPPEGDEQH